MRPSNVIIKFRTDDNCVESNAYCHNNVRSITILNNYEKKTEISLDWLRDCVTVMKGEECKQNKNESIFPHKFPHKIKLSRYLCPTCKRILIEGELEGTQFIRCQNCGDISEICEIPGSHPRLIHRWEDDVEYVPR